MTRQFFGLIGLMLVLLAGFSSCSLSEETEMIPEMTDTAAVVEKTRPEPFPSLTTIVQMSEAAATAVLLPSPTLPVPPTVTATAALSEPAGCLKPPDDYTRVQLPNATLNARTLAMLQQAAVLYDGEIDLLNAVTQGSYTDAEAASFGTHSGGGAVDLSVMRTGTYTVLWDEVDPLILALRTAGFAAWLRDLDALYPGSPIHIHAVAVGDRELSYTAQLQVYGDFGYFAGMDGLTPPAGQAPSPDPHGGPVLCSWMLDLLSDD